MDASYIIRDDLAFKISDLGLSKLLDNATGELSRLPGVGRRTALRLAMHLLRQPYGDVERLAAALIKFRGEIKYCSICNNLSDDDICPICASSKRDHSIVCVVESASDVMSIENTNQYRGTYHVLGGVISPMQGIAPSDLKIDKLLERVATGGINEVILAISTTVEGETTSFYISKRLSDYPNVKVSTIARGIGFGDELEYADELTIAHALHNRTVVNNQ